MSYPILDFTSTTEELREHNPNSNQDVLMLVPGPSDLVLYHWAGFDHKAPKDGSMPPMKWAEFMGFCRQRCDLPHQEVDTLSLQGGRMLVDAWCDNYKWGRSRSRYTRGLVPMLTRVHDAGLIDRGRTPIWLGNWASGEGYEPLGTLNEIADDLMQAKTLVLWHGTTSLNAAEIMRRGFSLETVSLNKSKKKAVYFSASAFRAGYFAQEAVKRQRRLLRKEEPAKWTKAKLASIQPRLIRCLFDREKVSPHLLPDEDWLALARHEGIEPGDGWASLMEFGQVAMRDVPHHLPEVYQVKGVGRSGVEERDED